MFSRINVMIIALIINLSISYNLISARIFSFLEEGSEERGEWGGGGGGLWGG